MFFNSNKIKDPGEEWNNRFIKALNRKELVEFFRLNPCAKLEIFSGEKTTNHSCDFKKGSKWGKTEQRSGINIFGHIIKDEAINYDGRYEATYDRERYELSIYRDCKLTHKIIHNHRIGTKYCEFNQFFLKSLSKEILIPNARDWSSDTIFRSMEEFEYTNNLGCDLATIIYYSGKSARGIVRQINSAADKLTKHNTKKVNFRTMGIFGKEKDKDEKVIYTSEYYPNIKHANFSGCMK